MADEKLRDIQLQCKHLTCVLMGRNSQSENSWGHWRREARDHRPAESGPRHPQRNHRSFWEWEAGGSEPERETEDAPTLLALKTKEGPGATGGRRFPEAGKGKDKNSPPMLPRAHSPADPAVSALGG